MDAKHLKAVGMGVKVAIETYLEAQQRGELLPRAILTAAQTPADPIGVALPERTLELLPLSDQDAKLAETDAGSPDDLDIIL